MQKIDKRLSGVKWITMFYPEQPNEEIESINFAVKVLKNDNKKNGNHRLPIYFSFFKMSMIILSQDFGMIFTVTRLKIINFLVIGKILVTKKIKENDISNIYVLKPLHGEDKPLENIFGHCLQKKILSTTLYKIDQVNAKFKWRE